MPAPIRAEMVSARALSLRHVRRQRGEQRRFLVIEVPVDQVAHNGRRGGQRRPIRAEFAQPAANDPPIALVRSAASDEHAAAHLLVAMQENSAAAHRSMLSPDAPAEPGDGLDTRVALAGSHMIGVAFSRCIARTEPLASMPPGQLAAQLTRVLWHILFEETAPQ
ncbi:TetR/AcrR family transcriptional regulator [Streptomyces sp. GQFP]|uniref:TetR/AcrR family transcriptional regulator n=1 Tax=Streptomyces sp. GQFP TaxID=2907545 RepID=UPI001F34263D|nr:hypothetical protein [Streptomyces sp. GQFP]UIX32589.1 hypothetical protein LUX31_22545 [Streptomyces sp. GQFP]